MDLTSKVLEVFPFDVSQTAEHLFAHFRKRVQKHFSGDTLIHSFTTDNGANYVAAMKLLLEKEDHLPCFAHTLQLVVKMGQTSSIWSDVIKNINTISKAARDIKSFRQGMKNTLNIKRSITRRVPTRWSSDFNMVESFLPIGTVIAAMMVMEEDVSFVPEDILEIMTADLVRDAKIFVEIFKPFAEITTRCQSVKKIIIVEIPTWIQSLKDHLSLLYVKYASNQLVHASLHVLSDALTDRFAFIGERFNPIIYACALHPTFQDLSFVTAANVKRDIDDRLADIYLLLNSDIDKELIVPLIRALRVALARDKLSCIDPHEAVSKFWNTVASPFNMFKDLARMVFSAQPTSVASEATFSASGHLKSKLRGRLAPSKVNSMTVLRKNVPKNEVASFVDGFCHYILQKGIKGPDDIKINSNDDDSDDSSTGSDEADVELIPFDSEEPDVILE
jgi:hypothetical protein